MFWDRCVHHIAVITASHHYVSTALVLRGCVVKTFKKKTNEEEKATVQVWHPGQWICWSVIVGLLSGCRLFRMLLVLSEDHKEHLAFLPKVEPAGK